MAVRRSKLGYAQDEPARQHLGRLLVTIDDLRALVDVLEAEGQSPGEIRIGFDGGEIDEPEDLRSLTDEELTRLDVKTPKVEVVLDSAQAVAIGDVGLVRAVSDRWARKRDRPPRVAGLSLGNRLLKKWWPISVFIPPIVIGAILVLLDGGSVWSSWVVLGSGVLAMALFLRILAVGATAISYAVIDPRTHDEVRKDAPLQRRHRTAVVATITGIVCGAATAIITKLWL